MNRVVAFLLGLALLAGAGLAAGRGGGGGQGGGGGRGGGGHAGSAGGHTGMAGHPGMGGRVSGGPMHFTTGPTRFTTGPMHFTTGPHPGHPIAGGHPPAVVVGKPIHTHRVFIGGAFVVAAPFFWYPPYPYPYYSYPYPYVAPGYGGPAYTQSPTYIEQGGAPYYYYCPDYQDYYPTVQTCPSPWMQVLPDAGAPATN